MLWGKEFLFLIIHHLSLTVKLISPAYYSTWNVMGLFSVNVYPINGWMNHYLGVQGLQKVDQYFSLWK